MALSYGELCHVLRNMEIGDLVSLVISPPNDDALLGKFKEGLSEPVARILVEDCNYYASNGSFSADFASGIVSRSEATLSATESRRATAKQLDQLRPLALQLAAFPGTEWYHQAGFPAALLCPLMALSGGLTGPFALRVKELASPRAWEFFSEDYADEADEPLTTRPAEQALTGLPSLLADKPWPFVEADATSEEDVDELFDDIDALLMPSSTTKEKT